MPELPCSTCTARSWAAKTRRLRWTPWRKRPRKLPKDTPDQQLELAYDQWAVAQLAADVGKTALARDFGERALAYRSMWLKIFRDLGEDADRVKARGLYQGTLWQYRWAPVFDLGWLQNEALGRQRFAAELDAFFNGELFNMTNEPDIHAPFLFALTDTPEKMDAMVTRLRDGPYNHWYENQKKYERPIWQHSFSALRPASRREWMTMAERCRPGMSGLHSGSIR